MAREDAPRDDSLPLRQIRRWIGVGDVLQVGVLMVVIAVSYTKQGGRIDGISSQATANALSIAQLHEAIDAVRWQRDATPEAERRLALLEQRVTMLEADRIDFKQSVQRQMDRMEAKLDKIVEGS